MLRLLSYNFKDYINKNFRQEAFNLYNFYKYISIRSDFFSTKK